MSSSRQGFGGRGKGSNEAVGVGKDSTAFVNALYGVFTCAKEKIVRAGRAGCAANYRPVLRPNPCRERVPYKKRLNRKRRLRRKDRGAGTVGESTVANEPTEEVVIAESTVAAAVEPIIARLPKLVVEKSRPVSTLGGTVDSQMLRAGVERKGKPRVEPGMATSANWRGVNAKRKAVPRQPTAADLDWSSPVKPLCTSKESTFFGRRWGNFDFECPVK